MLHITAHRVRAVYDEVTEVTGALLARKAREATMLRMERASASWTARLSALEWYWKNERVE